VCPVKYELGFYIPEEDILHSHRPEKQKSYIRCKFSIRGWPKSCAGVLDVDLVASTLIVYLFVLNTFQNPGMGNDTIYLDPEDYSLWGSYRTVQTR
jgi:hypothetical protein